MIELEGLIHGTLMSIRCEDQYVCIFVQNSLKEFEITHACGCLETCKQKCRALNKAKK